VSRRPEIVFLDEGTVNLRDTELSSLKRLGRYRGYATTSQADVIRRSSPADIVITNKCRIGRREFDSLPGLRMIAIAATGLNNIDLEEARRRGVVVANVPRYSTGPVAEHAILFILAFSHRLVEHHRAALGRWARSRFYAILDYPFNEVAGRSLGIVGYGAIGRQVAKLARGLGMKVLVARIPGRRYRGGPSRRPLAEVLKKSDFVGIHCALSKGTRHLISRRNLRRMKSSAVLLNVARGAIVHEADVARALRKGWIAGYATDVLTKERPPANHPLLSRELRGKVLMTPHIAWASREARQRLVDEVAKNTEAFLMGRKRNRIV